VRKWIVELESNPTSVKSNYAANNLRFLVHVSNQSVPFGTAQQTRVVKVMKKTS
jgi:hypothetical protein